MLTKEEIFIKDLSAFLVNEIDFNDVIVNKLKSLLKKYKESVSDKEYITHNFFVYKTSFGTEVSPYSDKKIMDKYTIEGEFNKYCDDRGIDSQIIRRPEKCGRSKKEITNVRIDFCNYAAQNFIVNKSELAAFFNLNHATIHYYFNPNSKKNDK